MKKLLLACLIALLFVAGIFAARGRSPQISTLPQGNIPEDFSPTPPPPAKTVTVDNQTIGYAVFVVRAGQVSLIPNFTESKASGQLMSEHSCRAGVNGGFYDAAGRPLGLFESDGIGLRGISASTLINGFFGVSRADVPFINTGLPQASFRFVLQTGPLLVADGAAVRLTIRADEHARRMIAATTTDNTMVFIALYQPESVFDGPLLGHVPEFVLAIGQKESLAITNAINLDGGSASAFYTEQTTLSELTPVGSFFCVKS